MHPATHPAPGALETAGGARWSPRLWGGPAGPPAVLTPKPQRNRAAPRTPRVFTASPFGVSRLLKASASREDLGPCQVKEGHGGAAPGEAESAGEHGFGRGERRWDGGTRTHRDLAKIIESCRLEKTCKITESNRKPNAAKSTAKPCP